MSLLNYLLHNIYMNSRNSYSKMKKTAKNVISFPLMLSCSVRSYSFRLGTQIPRSKIYQFVSREVHYIYFHRFDGEIHRRVEMNEHIITRTRYQFVAQFTRFIVLYSQFNWMPFLLNRIYLWIQLVEFAIWMVNKRCAKIQTRTSETIKWKSDKKEFIESI